MSSSLLQVSEQNLRQSSVLSAREQIPVDDLIWVILEGDPREETSEEDAAIGATLKGGSPRAITDDARICFILDCCRCLAFLEADINSNF